MTNDGVEYVTVREWQQGRSEDRAEMRRLIADSIKGTEERLLKALEGSQRDRERLHEMVDGIQSVLDQQRGARNLMLFVGFTALANVGLLFLEAWHFLS